ncbi:MAG: hypothetical protein SF339_23755 [Blastocatellia bacterium]|nr:hypothetical protein [Blastocatellia bacterium]
MTEEEFIRGIDCAFPYDDRAAAERVIEEGAALSANAAFMALHEICRPSASRRVERELQWELLAAWRARFDHPLAGPVLRAARAIIEGAPLAAAEALEVMRAIESHPGQYNALAIVSFACEDEAVARVCEEILARWRAGQGA